MTKDKSGLPRFLYCSNPLVNDHEFILHTTNPRCLLKVIKEGKITTRVMQLFDQASQEQIDEIEKESLKKYFFYIRREQATKTQRLIELLQKAEVELRIGGTPEWENTLKDIQKELHGYRSGN